MILSFLFFLCIFAVIGLSSALLSRRTKQDYYVASQSMPPAFVGLSAVATNNSGYMFIGVIGYTYHTGLASIWLMIGWILGDFISSTFVHKRLHQTTVKNGSVSFAGLLSNWNQPQKPQLQKLIALISIFFLLAYASAQLVAGSKALEALLAWPAWSGAVIGAVLVAGYCLAGGIRASIWTDVAQSFVMIFAMAVLLVVALQNVGGIDSAVAQMAEVEGFLAWFPDDLLVPGLLGGFIFAIAWAFAGFSVIGQPHIMVRFMTLNSSASIRTARIWYYLWFTAFYIMATLVGMLARIYLQDTGSFDAELALPTMAMQLLSPVLVGLVLAGIFASTISTADSLILSCSSALTHDLLGQRGESMGFIKLGTLAITAAALGIALVNEQSVFNLVIMAWSGLASAFAPLLIVLCLGAQPSQRLSILAMLCGLLTAVLWRYYGLHSAVYEGMPGILVGLAVLLPSYWPMLLKASAAKPPTE